MKDLISICDEIIAASKKTTEPPYAEEVIFRQIKLGLAEAIGENITPQTAWLLMSDQLKIDAHFIFLSANHAPDLARALKEAMEVLNLIAHGKSNGPYSAMHRIKAAREFLKTLEGK